VSADAAGAPPDHVDIVRAGIRIHPDEPDDVMVDLKQRALAALDALVAERHELKNKLAVQQNWQTLYEREKAGTVREALIHTAAPWRTSANTALDAMEARERALVAERDRLRESWDVASWYIKCLRDYIDKVPVRGLAEARAAYESIRAALKEQP
jgi:hypothetical protein